MGVLLAIGRVSVIGCVFAIRRIFAIGRDWVAPTWVHRERRMRKVNRPRV